jgi:hypothetical protein
MSHFFVLRRSWRTKTVRFPILDAKRAKQSKAWNIDNINFCVSTHRGRDPIQNADDWELAILLRRTMIAQPPPEVWERIEERAGQMRGAHLSG